VDPTREREVEQASVTTEPAPAGPTEAPNLSGPLTAARIAALQRNAGNAAVARLLNGRPPAAPRRRGSSGAGSLARYDAATYKATPAGATDELLDGASGGAAAGAAAGQLFGGAPGAGAGSAAEAALLGGAAGGAAGAGPVEAAGSAGAAASGLAGGGAAGSAGAAASGLAGAAGGGAAGAAAADLLGAAGGGAAGAAASGVASAAGGGAAGAAVSEILGAAHGAAAGAGSAGAATESAGAGAGGGGSAGAGSAGAASEAKGAASAGAAGAAGAGTESAGGGGSAGGSAGAGAAGAAAEAKGSAGAGAASAAAGGAAGAVAAAEAKGAASGGAASKGGAGAGAAGAGAEAKGASGAAGGGGAAKAGAGAASAGAGHAAAAGGAAAGPAINKDPHADPAFQAMKGKSQTAAGGSKAHAPASSGAANAQAAAVPPSNDLSSQAQAAQVDEMATKEPGAFDRAAFIQAVKQAVDNAAPKNLEDADDFKDGGAAKVKGEVTGLVGKGKDESQKDIKDATVAAPDASKAKPKQVEPMTNEPVGQGTATVGAANAMPAPVPPAATDLSAGPNEIDKQMADAEVTDEQIDKSNEPTFKGALDARDDAKDHSNKAPGDFRKQEEGVLGKAQGDAAGMEAQGLQQMHGARGQAFQQAVGHKQGAKTEDEGKRAKVASDIQGIYEKTKTDVTKTLGELDGKVDAAFTAGEGAARKRFEDYVGKRMDAYKDDRYDGILGGARWLKDKLLGMPSEVNVFYAEGKTQYLGDMDAVIGKVADVVGAGLTAARARIAAGKAEITKYVAQLPQDLQKVGKEAESKLDSQFEQLTADVDSKQSELVDTLARKYVESRDQLDARIDDMKAANRGLVDKAIDAVAGVIKTIIQLKNMLLGVLAKAADVIGDIIADPIGFLGKLVDGIKAGLNRFVGNIGTHLQEGLMGWLFGAIGRAGIQLPKSFDIAGIFDLVMQVLGLTYRQIRSRVVKLVGEKVMTKLEQTVDVFKVLVTEGIPGLWKWIKDKVGDLEDLVIGGIKSFIIEKVIKAGITWLIAFLNPAAAFIKACKMIYDVIMFIIERGAEIMDFVRSILDSIGAIAKGAIGVVAEKVEGSLAKALPLAISFLASLLGLGGISEKIHEVIQKVQAPIGKAVDFVVMGAVKGAKKLFGAGLNWAKGKVKQGKEWVKGKVQDVKDRVAGRPKTPEEREQQLSGGLSALDALTARFAGKGATRKQILAEVKAIQRQFPVFRSIDVKPDGDRWDYVYVASPPVDKSGPPRSARTFTLAPGGLRAQEGRVLTGQKDGKTVHLFAKHVDIAEAELPERLKAQKQNVITVRDRKVQAAQLRIDAREKELDELNAAQAPTKPDKIAKRQQKIESRTKQIADDRQAIATLQAMDLDDREAIKKFMEGEKPMYTTSVTKFTNEHLLEQAINQAVTENAALIERTFLDANGDPVGAGANVLIKAKTLQNLGIGYELGARNEIVQIAQPLTGIAAMIVLVDPANGHFVVETAYPEP
jgi:hypothetical protein